MNNLFYEQPILNSPYNPPNQHWELDEARQPTQKIIEKRRRADFITPFPKPKRQVGESSNQTRLVYDSLSSEQQEYHAGIINGIREHIDQWRNISDPNKWKVSRETAKLLEHWRHHSFNNIRPFFCQIEAVETAIWLTEVAPRAGKSGKKFLDYLADANSDANTELPRLGIKLATGAGKTTVMAMLIAWQTINAMRHPNNSKFTRNFLVVTPGITIKDRLRVLQPNDPDSYYQNRELIPNDMLPELNKARIVVTNYHRFKLRDRLAVSKGGRSLLQGSGEPLNTQETEGQMLQRLMPQIMNEKNVMIINDEAHHCYREKSDDERMELSEKEDMEEIQTNAERARLWISGLETISKKFEINRVIDLSATPFFLRGSGYLEGTLFPWTMSDFSLMDAIECGIVKLPRIPVADNIPSEDMPKFRNLWEHIRPDMPRKGRRDSKNLDPLSLPTFLKTALEALYGHYEKVFDLWKKESMEVSPCFIIVCNNTATSKLIYDYVSGFIREDKDGTKVFENGRLPLFRNFDDNGERHPRPYTLLIDSEQLETGDALDENFRKIAASDIDRFRREWVIRTGDHYAAEHLGDQDILREVMNTVGKSNRLGSSIRCVVSVSMLSEGWDANTVTHVLGVRAFGTQLLCEQVVGRALRRLSYSQNKDGLLNVEYADVLGIPFDFTSEPTPAPPNKPQKLLRVKAMHPERDHLEIRFPRVDGYRKELPEEILEAEFNEDSVLELSPELVGPSYTKNQGIIGEGIDLTLVHTNTLRQATILFHLTQRLLYEKYRDSHESPKLHLFGQLKRIAKQWLTSHLVCRGDTYPAQLMYRELADMACEKIAAGITRTAGDHSMKAMLNPYNPYGSTSSVDFNVSVKTRRYETDPRYSHINYAVLDSKWEAEFCQVVESHSRVKAYAKNHGLGFDIPYCYMSKTRKYIPDFLVLIDDGHGENDLLHLVAEVKGVRKEDAKAKKTTMETFWVPGVNNLKTFGRWDFAEFTDVYSMRADLDRYICNLCSKPTTLSTADQPALKE